MTEPVNDKFTRLSRLTESTQYRKVFSDHFRLTDQYWTILVRVTKSGPDGARLGMAIAKKTVPRSVDRNRLKRIIRESFRLHRRELGSVDLVVMARKNCLATENAVLNASLGRMWKKLISRCANSSKR